MQRDAYHGRHRRKDLVPDADRRGRLRPAAAALIVATIAFGGFALSGSGVHKRQPAPPAAIDEAGLDRSEPAGRSMDRRSTASPPAGAAASPTAAASATASATASAPSPPAAPGTSSAPAKATPRPATTGATPKSTTLVPVGGLTQRQMNHSATIVKVGQQRQLPKRAYVIAIATALQESYLRNLANVNVPASLALPNEGVGADHDSVGLFQQRPSSGWGTVAQCMDPAYAAGKFYERLSTVYGWQSMSLAAAAQAVQVSAFPEAYAKHEPLATLITDALT